jgi:TRAP-type transport system periplasmic protein
MDQHGTADRFRRSALAVCAAFAAIALAGGLAPEAAAKQTLKLGHLQAPANHQHVASQRFAELLAEKSKGEYEVKLFPAAQLGSGRDMLEAVRQGNLEMTVFGSDLLEPIVPAMGALSLPFIWDREKAHKLLRGDVGTDLAGKFLAATGVRIIAWGDLGEQSIITRTKAVRAADDLRGLKIRTPEVPSTVGAFRAWGANPTVITFAEVYNALQTGVVDGAVMPPDQMFTSRLYEVAKQLSVSRHLYIPLTVLISDKVFQAQPAEARATILAAAHEAFEVYDAELYVKASTQAVEDMKAKGVTVTQPDRETFRKAVSPVWKEFVDRVPDAASVVKAIETAP